MITFAMFGAGRIARVHHIPIPGDFLCESGNLSPAKVDAGGVMKGKVVH